MFTFVVASHNEEILNKNTLNSELYRSEKYPFLICRGFDKCTKAYNSVKDKIETPYVVYLHHDLELYYSVENTLISSINKLEKYNWGVAGVAGVTHSNVFIGSCYSYGYLWGQVILNENEEPFPVKVLDELFLVKKNDGYMFDENIPYNHLYGTDVCLHYLTMKKENFVIPVQTINHNANRNRNPNENVELKIAGEYVSKKYPKLMPTKTTCLTIGE